jgi:hypothetical protein
MTVSHNPPAFLFDLDGTLLEGNWLSKRRVEGHRLIPRSEEERHAARMDHPRPEEHHR